MKEEAMMSKKWLVDILPLVGLFSVGCLVGSQFEVLWMRVTIGLSAGIAAYFLFRQWGKLIYK